MTNDDCQLARLRRQIIFWMAVEWVGYAITVCGVVVTVWINLKAG